MKLFQLIRMVLWSFFGVRKRSGLESDLKSVNPLQVIVVAIFLATIFVGILLAAVNSAIGILS
jgi:hypothetical protein